MILYREGPYPIQMKNVMLLDDTKSGGVVYVNKTTYDQALLLSGRLDGDPKRVLDILRSPKTEAYRATIGLKDLVEEMMSTMPKPLDMLAPFLIFCVQNHGIQWDPHDRVFAYGVLHQFSQLVDFNAITLVPVEVRNNITVATSILKEYETSWDELCSSLKDHVVLGGVQQATVVQMTPVQSQTQQTVPAQLTPQQSQQTQAVQQSATTPASDSVEDRIKAFQAKMAREAEEDRKEREAKAAKKKAAQNEEAKTAAASVANTANKTESSQSVDVLAEFDI